ncbi:MAG: DNA-binding HxlR family transcriptional regulator [Flammeovirgaceae bacterium]|jgi:DNA-binding HxlR family transcriptional regulator
MLLNRKKTFKEMSSSKEGIATNLLSSRLKLLESLEVISKRKLPVNKKENIYLLTEKGIDLAPIVLEIALWSDKYVRSYNPEMRSLEGFTTNKIQLIESTQKEYRDFSEGIIG